MIAYISFNISVIIKARYASHPSQKSIAHLDLQSFVVDSNRKKLKRQKLPNLENIDWPKREFLSLPMGAPGSREVPLKPHFSRGQMRITWKLFSIFEDGMEELGLSDKWMIYAGSLIGSLRHHDITPWDDDLDVLVDFEVRPMLWKKFSTLAPKIIIGEAGLRDKLYAKLIEPSNTARDVEGSRKLSAYNWGWPSIDIGYFLSNATHIQERASSYGKRDIHPKSDVFPLIFRPFYKRWVPAPRHAFSVLTQSYPKDFHCSSFGWSHPFENGMRKRSIACTKLARRYAFVEHSPFYGKGQDKAGSLSDLIWVRERLIRGGQIIHEIPLVAHRVEAHLDTYKLRVNS
ncbi:unnamed protein product [Dibothriocephalus latus]|uniref:LicD/FKTN/FKRP nucleotidyltransferase domain-containing protein n=1 Tax=Dibothriocephalus latus TaxID=60516 RepID=A0A3P7PAX7_DIBLA|nr:unnamed protein product [Dibothriocephalus latus]